MWKHLGLLSVVLVAGCGEAVNAVDLGQIGCGSDSACSAPRPRCDLNSRTCVPCLPTNDNCPKGQRCVASNGSFACMGGCLSDADCPRSDAGTATSCCSGACVDTSSDSSSCGRCGATCLSPANATAGCSGGVCGVGACNAGFLDCDRAANNGCEVNSLTDGKNCGACGKACAAGANQGATCAGGTCQVSCSAGFADCDGNAANGCEVNVQSDAANCGACGTTCKLPNASSTCKAGGCVIDKCAAGFDDCDQMAQDGCESDLGSDVNHCGSCIGVCMVANGAPACRAGSCGILSCNAGFADCDNLYLNGCELKVADDINNCGKCGVRCQGQNSMQLCQMGTCQISLCAAGFSDCDKDPKTGCEVNVGTDLNNCGGCGNVCPVPNNASATCANATCGVGQCKFGFADCDKDPKNGCEVDLQTVQNCGSCGTVCQAPANATAGCKAGVCGIGMCNALFGDCDGNAGNGCEKNLATDVMNCGKCGTVCAFANAQAACLGGQCGIVACAMGYGDCDNKPANGCEAGLSGDANNCGACGKVCPQNAQYCVNSVCSPNSPGTLLGTLNGQKYYKVQVMGVMSDNNVAAACQAAGLKVPCSGPNGCMYNGNMMSCVPTQELSCGNPMQTLSQALCNGANPSSCPALYNCFQYMANTYANGSACGALAGVWCAVGNNFANLFAICTP